MDARTDDLQERIAAFLTAHTTLALATVGPDGPAVAPVFYAAGERLDLYFLSEPGTAHGRNLAANPAAAAAIYADEADWRSLRGLQLRGRADLVPAAGLAQAAAVYGRKYAFVAALLAGDGGPGVLAGPLARARFYVLRPTWLRLVDNTVFFGFKQELTLPGASRAADT